MHPKDSKLFTQFSFLMLLQEKRFSSLISLEFFLTCFLCLISVIDNPSKIKNKKTHLPPKMYQRKKKGMTRHAAAARGDSSGGRWGEWKKEKKEEQ